MTKLNKRQRAFAEAYAIPGTDTYGNAYKSALKAGYSEKTANAQSSRLLGYVGVQEYIKRVENDLYDQNIMSGKEVLYRLTRTARGETEEVEPIVTKTGDYKVNPLTNKPQLVYDEHIHMVKKPPKISDQNKALELLGKHHKLFTDVQDMNVNGVVNFNDDID
ncbi:terminase small subunit [uncultured Staphylococcus sp.]|uniref:terminase small subunit n=1 Tax=uncultured Staphylococcus sp. TaxID=189668 RepID=UPI0025D24C69|nr:terminase small subunit [uncultured Staphylococcus sp.]